MKHLIYTILTVLFFSACNTSPGSSSENTMTDTTNTITKENYSTSQLISAEFIVESLPDTFDMPKSVVHVQIGDQKIEVATITGQVQIFNQEEMADFPDNAVSACGAWWAGAGEYFYIASNVDGWKIYKGWMEETQEDEGYHWELLQVIQ